MKTFGKGASGVFFCLFEILIGILLLVDPVGFTSGIITAAGVVLIAVGIFCIIGYFRADAWEAAVGQSLAKGLAALLGGLFCVWKSEWFLVTFPVFTVVYGIFILVSGLGKIQLTVDMIRMKNGKWFFGAIGALVSVVCAVVILQNPFTTTAVLWKFTGVTLLVEAVIDLLTVFVSKRKENAQIGG